MKRTLTKLIAMLLILTVSIPLLSGCQGKKDAAGDIVILFTNDVHCAVDTDIGYAGLAAYKEAMKEKTPYVTLVDCGDAIQGQTIGAISQGEYPVDIMNEVGYDYAILGNHEFDYGMDRLEELLYLTETQYLGCNLRYTGSGNNALDAVAPYALAEYGDTTVAFVGVSTPESIAKSTPAYFMDESGNFVYDFCGSSGEELCAQVQAAVDQCRADGADYVIALTHLGTDESSAPFRSVDVIAGTTGIDAVLDGHSHSVIPCDVVENKAGEDVLLSSTGTGLNNIGQLVITAGGNLSTGLIGTFPHIDSGVDAYIKDIQSQFEADLAEVVGHTDVALTTVDSGGVRLIRSRETNLGDFCADAYRAVSGADIAFVNGGGVRADIAAGDITYGDVINVHPYGNNLCVAEATGQEILDALEMGSRDTQAQVSDGDNAVGENGGFLQVYGLRYTIDTSVESSVEVDDMGMFVSCGGARRVRDVEILQADGSYAPIDPGATYTVASHNYMIKEGGDGFTMFMDNALQIDEGMVDYQILMTYLADELGGAVGGAYSAPQGRITVR